MSSENKTKIRAPPGLNVVQNKESEQNQNKTQDGGHQSRNERWKKRNPEHDRSRNNSKTRNNTRNNTRMNNNTRNGNNTRNNNNSRNNNNARTRNSKNHHRSNSTSHRPQDKVRDKIRREINGLMIPGGWEMGEGFRKGSTENPFIDPFWVSLTLADIQHIDDLEIKIYAQVKIKLCAIYASLRREQNAESFGDTFNEILQGLNKRPNLPIKKKKKSEFKQNLHVMYSHLIDFELCDIDEENLELVVCRDGGLRKECAQWIKVLKTFLNRFDDVQKDQGNKEHVMTNFRCNQPCTPFLI